MCWREGKKSYTALSKQINSEKISTDGFHTRVNRTSPGLRQIPTHSTPTLLVRIYPCVSADFHTERAQLDSARRGVRTQHRQATLHSSRWEIYALRFCSSIWSVMITAVMNNSSLLSAKTWIDLLQSNIQSSHVVVCSRISFLKNNKLTDCCKLIRNQFFLEHWKKQKTARKNSLLSVLCKWRSLTESWEKSRVFAKKWPLQAEFWKLSSHILIYKLGIVKINSSWKKIEHK